MLKKINKHFLLLHFIVFIWGWSPILGKGISANAMQLVWFRIAITIVLMAIYLVYIKANLLIPKKKLIQLILIGFIQKLIFRIALLRGAAKSANWLDYDPRRGCITRNQSAGIAASARQPA